jgi:hypothetical protein
LILQVIVDQLRDPTFANLQVFCIPCRLDVSAGYDQTKFFGKPPDGKQQLSLLMCLEHPLSRGSVHITSSDPLKPPQIDPGYFRNPADVKILSAGMKWMEKVANHPLMKKSLGERELPPKDKSLGTEEERMEYIRNHISTQYHLIGTATMGEVVDDRLKVKGVNRLRVIDASVSIQSHQQCHLRQFQTSPTPPPKNLSNTLLISDPESITLFPSLIGETGIPGSCEWQYHEYYVRCRRERGRSDHRRSRVLRSWK